MKVLIVTQIGIWLPGVIRIIIIQPMDKKFNLLCATQIATVTDYGFHEEFHTIASSNVSLCIYTFEAPLLSFQSSVRSAKIFFHRTEGSMLISVSAQFSSNSRFYNCFVLISVYFFFVYVILLKKGERVM